MPQSQSTSAAHGSTEPAATEKEYRPVLTKRDFVRRYKAGEFGNAAPTWDTVDQFLEYVGTTYPPADQLYHLRNRNAGGDTFYNLTYYELRNKVLRLSKADYYVSAMAPTPLTTIQGELRRGSIGLEFYCTNVARPMRDALAQKSWTMHGIGVSCYLATYLNDKSREWIQHLLDAYPDHVIEFSCYSKCWGTVPGHNTVFWEVRKY